MPNNIPSPGSISSNVRITAQTGGGNREANKISPIMARYIVSGNQTSNYDVYFYWFTFTENNVRMMNAILRVIQISFIVVIIYTVTTSIIGVINRDKLIPLFYFHLQSKLNDTNSHNQEEKEKKC